MSRPALSVSLDAVIVRMSGDDPQILTVQTPDGPAIPSGPLDPDRDPTLERALRRWITDQSGVEIGYAEQLYTFGDLDRGSGRTDGDPRWLSVAYLALVRDAVATSGATWLDLYDLLPWEDRRRGVPSSMDRVLPFLHEWAGDDEGRTERVSVLFADVPAWDGIRVLERYELLYEAGAVAEAVRDRSISGGDDVLAASGAQMVGDHRRIAATALGRLRGKLTYRPVVFELLPDTFTLTVLQRTVEALAGVDLHTQNFRRLVERTRLVEGTGERTTATGGRPAELFRFRPEVWRERPRPGVGVPYR